MFSGLIRMPDKWQDIVASMLSVPKNKRNIRIVMSHTECKIKTYRLLRSISLSKI